VCGGGCVTPLFSTGIDDAQALFVFLRAHEQQRIRIVAITCVNGNAALEDVVGNVCAVLAAYGIAAQEIPVYVGCDRALIIKHGSASEWHGFGGWDVVDDYNSTLY
jgi:inosine-uridine nucleoside N-ribohydrolase